MSENVDPTSPNESHHNQPPLQPLGTVWYLIGQDQEHRIWQQYHRVFDDHRTIGRFLWVRENGGYPEIIHYEGGKLIGSQLLEVWGLMLHSAVQRGIRDRSIHLN